MNEYAYLVVLLNTKGTALLPVPHVIGVSITSASPAGLTVMDTSHKYATLMSTGAPTFDEARKSILRVIAGSYDWNWVRRYMTDDFR